MNDVFRSVWNNETSRDEEILWRYMSADRLISLLSTSELYFAAATEFSDRFEGATAVQAASPIIDDRFPELSFGEIAFKELRRLTKVNCWHTSEYESDAMWKLYASQGKGVAICTTPAKIRLALQPFRLASEYSHETLWHGTVRYCDLTKVRLGLHSIERFFYKHQAFSWEREYRLAISLCSAEEFGVHVPEFGIKVRVDLDALLNNIVLGPELSRDDRIKIEKHVAQSRYSNNLVTSTLLWHPRYI